MRELNSMGILYTCQTCDTCGYQSPHLLRYHIGEAGLFMGIVTCHTCADIVSLFPAYDNIPEDITVMLGGAARYLARGNALASHHADIFPTGVMAFDICIVCGRRDVTHHHIMQPRYNLQGRIGLPCPRCEVGRVALVPAGTWE
jgi:hypothetical protein